jgi:hypothetical protein
MKSLLLTLEYPPFKGGIANYYGNLAKYWPDPEGLEIVKPAAGHWLKTWPKLRQALKEEPKTFVLIGQILPLGTLALLQDLFRPFSYGVFLHGMDFAFALKKPRKKRLAAAILKHSQRIICANSHVAELVRESQPFSY